MHTTERSAGYANTTDITIDGEVSAYRRGFIAFQIDAPAKLFRYNDSNQWNNSFVRALNPADIDEVKRAVAAWPACDTEGKTGNGPVYWQVTLRVGDSRETFSGNRNSDPVWRHVSALVEAIGGK